MIKTKGELPDPEVKSSALKTASFLLAELESNPFTIANIAKLAQAYLQSGQSDKAIAWYEKFVKFDSTNYCALISLGLLRLMEANYTKSYEILTRAAAIPQAKREPALWLGLGSILFKFDLLEKAEAAYKLVLTLSPGVGMKKEAMCKLGLISLRKKDADKAMIYFKNAQVGENLRVDLLCFSGSCYEMQGKLPEAIGIYASVCSVQPDDFKAHQYLGWAYFLSGQYDQATSTLTKALNLAMEQKAETADLHFLLGRVAQAAPNFELAEKEFQLALQLDPDNSFYLIAMGTLSMYQQRIQQAQEYLVRSTNVPYKGHEAWFNLGNIYSGCGQRDMAAHAFNKALAIDPACSLAQTRLKEVVEGKPPSNFSFIGPPVRISDVCFSHQTALKFNEAGPKEDSQKTATTKGRGKVARREDRTGAPAAATVLSHLKGFLKNPMEMSRSDLQSMMSTASSSPRLAKTEENPIFAPIMTSLISRLQDSLNPKVKAGVEQPQKRRH